MVDCFTDKIKKLIFIFINNDSLAVLPIFNLLIRIRFKRIHFPAFFRRCSAFVRSLGGVLAEALLYLAVVCTVVLRSGKDVYLTQRIAADFLKSLGLAYRVAVCVSVDLNSAVKLFLREACMALRSSSRLISPCGMR